MSLPKSGKIEPAEMSDKAMAPLSSESEQIKPTRAAFLAIKREYPNKSAAERYLLAQARTLIDWFYAEQRRRASKGGKARMKQLPAKARAKLASKAAKARWSKNRKGR